MKKYSGLGTQYSVLLALLAVVPLAWADDPPKPTAPPKPLYETRQVHDPNGIGKFYMGREIAQFMSHLAADWLDRPEREQEGAASNLLGALPLAPGMVGADSGCGAGYFTFRLADKVGPKGRVLAVDIQDEMLAIVKQRMKARGVSNVEPVKGAEDDPKLPAGG